MAYHLGVAGKPYSDGELVKRCLINVVKCIHSGKEADYSSIALSRVTTQRRQGDIAQLLKLSLQAKINKKESLLSLAVDESTDINDSAKLLIFVRCLSSSFELFEDFLSMETLATRARGEDIFITVKNACFGSGLDLKCLRISFPWKHWLLAPVEKTYLLQKLFEDFLSMETLATRARGEDIFITVKNACFGSGLDLKYLRGICTDRAPAMTGNQQGFVTRFSDYVSNKYDNKELINLHCIIHQEALCAKSVALNTILKDINRIILFNRANALDHRQF